MASLCHYFIYFSSLNFKVLFFFLISNNVFIENKTQVHRECTMSEIKLLSLFGLLFCDAFRGWHAIFHTSSIVDPHGVSMSIYPMGLIYDVLGFVLFTYYHVRLCKEPCFYNLKLLPLLPIDLDHTNIKRVNLTFGIILSFSETWGHP